MNDDINLGATILHLNERPTITRPSIGDEPTRNTKYGFDVNYRKESRFLTKLVDALPLIQTKEPSSVALSAEFAQLLPGTSNVVNGDGTSYIDDFENFATPYNLSGWQNWQLAATPRVGARPIGEEAGLPGRLGEGAQRAKLAWYVVDKCVLLQSKRAKTRRVRRYHQPLRTGRDPPGCVSAAGRTAAKHQLAIV